MKYKMFTIPNAITLMNLMCGCMAAFYAFRGDLQFTYIFILAAAVFDFLDGLAARLLNAYSPLGKQLDSLADMVSFGFAPSAVLLTMSQLSGGVGLWGWAMFLLAGFSALRLARFNIDETQSDEFVGLSTTACALLVASTGFLFDRGLFAVDHRVLVGAMLLLCLLLVCPVRMFSLKFHSWGLRANVLRYAFLAASLAAILVLGLSVAIPFIIVGYIVVSTIRWMTGKSLVVNG